MSESQSCAKGPPLPEPALLMICLDGAALATGPVAGHPSPQTVVFSPDGPEAGSDSMTQVPPGLHHIAAIPGPVTVECEVLRYNMPGLASLADPTADLLDLLPGLKETGRRPVQRLGPKDLVALLPTGVDITVHVNCPGAEAEVMDALWQCLGPDRITRITLHCGEAAFFKGSKGRAEIEQMLRARSYEQTGHDRTDPDWPVICFQPDLKARQITALVARVNELSASLATTLAAQAGAEARAAELLVQSRSLQEAKDAADQSLAATRAEHDAIRQSLAAQQTAAADAILKRDASLAELALAARMQAMQALDLRDLRTQLDHSTRERQRQEDLLRKLTPRLAQAAAHLHALHIGENDAPAEPIGKDVAQAKPAKLPGPPKDKKRRKTKPGPER
ncbi:hypothetical protein EEB11_14675 [Pseudotabrizicola sediminis]|uniref:Uncharacterized protein n=1 Tax=Pseudotabrizicola sediminis TaxID=2486418 RepID=A0ABY2KJR8_9RHOB|nr:hypothetical protein EEB11_14675 [Pseudotabrizicola sediminis]